MNPTRLMHQFRFYTFLSSAAILTMLAGCATEAPKTAAPVQTTTATQTPVSTASANATRATPSAPPVAQPAAHSAYFDYDSDAIKDNSVTTVRANAEYLVQSGARIELDGNADERGSRDYNMALGQKRAEAVKRALTAMGVKADRVDTVSFGEDKPKAKGHDEAAWAENRRVDIVKK